MSLLLFLNKESDRKILQQKPEYYKMKRLTDGLFTCEGVTRRTRTAYTATG